MPLSAEQFKQIIESLRSDSPTRSGFEKRTAPRVGLRTKLMIYPNCDQSRPLSAWLRDLSATGIGIVDSRPLETGSEFLVLFPLRGKWSLSAYYTVMHCEDLARNLYFIGARLERIVEDSAPAKAAPSLRDSRSSAEKALAKMAGRGLK
jgi:hypothetical protein